MKLVLLFILFFSAGISDEDLGVSADGAIHPSEFTVKLIKRCESLTLREAPNRKAEKINSLVWTEGCVQNFGCIRDITQKQLESTEPSKRDYLAWKYPVWCKVEAKGKIGWVRKQFLSDEPCSQEE